MRVILLLVVEHSIQKKPRASGKCLSSGLLTTKTDLGTWEGKALWIEKPETARGILQKITRITIYCSPHFRSPLIAEDAMGVGSGCPLTTPSKGGPGYFAMGASINTKEEVSVFVLEEGKEKKKKIYYRLLFFASIIQLIIHFELNSTAQYNNGFCQDH